jgi:hypothetical protein
MCRITLFKRSRAEQNVKAITNMSNTPDLCPFLLMVQTLEQQVSEKAAVKARRKSKESESGTAGSS